MGGTQQAVDGLGRQGADGPRPFHSLSIAPAMDTKTVLEASACGKFRQQPVSESPNTTNMSTFL